MKAEWKTRYDAEARRTSALRTELDALGAELERARAGACHAKFQEFLELRRHTLRNFQEGAEELAAAVRRLDVELQATSISSDAPEVAHLQRQHEELMARLDRQEAARESLNSEIADLQAEIRGKDGEIRSLQESINGTKESVPESLVKACNRMPDSTFALSLKAQVDRLLTRAMEQASSRSPVSREELDFLVKTMEAVCRATRAHRRTSGRVVVDD
jgi:chromosome segregation ATPase